MTTIREFEEIKGKGIVKVFVINGEDKVLWYYDPNVVVTIGKERLAKWLSGEVTDPPDVMVIGNGGASPPNNISPTAPDPADTSLNGRIGAGPPFEAGQTTANSAATQPAVISRSLATVRYDATFNANDLIHTDYPLFGSLGLDAIYVSELGLLTTPATDELFARVTFAPIQFQNGSSTSISVQWSVTIL